MNKNESLIPITVIGLTVLFTIVSLGVFLTRGKSAYWIAKKMRVGAMLLTLTAVSTTYSGCITSCYDAPEPNVFSINNEENHQINVNIDLNNKIKGTIYERSGDEFSFRITDTSFTKSYQLGRIEADDGEFDESAEEFTLELNSDIPTGVYSLNFYYYLVSPEDSIMNSYNSYQLNVTNN